MDEPITRRALIYNSALFFGCACACRRLSASEGPRSTNCDTPDLEQDSLVIGEKSVTIELAKAPSLREVGNAAYLVDREKKLDIIILHAGPDEYRALSRLCTHAYRPISYIRTRRLLMCNNANHSIFDLDGQVVKGPAPSAIRVYPVKLVDGKLEITL